MGYWNRPDTLSWFEPRWSFAPRIRKEFSLLLRPGFWLRVAVLAAPLAALLVVAIRRIPGVELSWGEATRMGAVSVGALIGMLAFAFGIHLLIPPTVRLSAKGLSRQTGNSVRWFRTADLISLTLDLRDPAKPRLRVEAKRKTEELGVGPKVSPERLTEFLRRTFPSVPLHQAA
jgi:hypothetical protein